MSADVIPVAAAEDKVMLALQARLDRLVAKAKPSKREITQQYFRDLYPKLEAHLASGKLQKDILAAFNELVQARVCARTFKEMLEQERARRVERGNPSWCVACRQPMKSDQQNHAPYPQASGSLSESVDFLPTYSE